VAYLLCGDSTVTGKFVCQLIILAYKFHLSHCYGSIKIVEVVECTLRLRAVAHLVQLLGIDGTALQFIEFGPHRLLSLLQRDSLSRAPHDIDETCIHTTLYIGIDGGKEALLVDETTRETTRLACREEVCDEVTHMIFTARARPHMKGHNEHICGHSTLHGLPTEALLRRLR
jgi:hypothetical protein